MKDKPMTRRLVTTITTLGVCRALAPMTRNIYKMVHFLPCKIPKESIIGVILLVFLAIGCSKTPASAPVTRDTITDRMGRTVTLPAAINRVISTAPSNTEIVAALGMANKLVAADTFSADVSGLPAAIPLMDFFRPDAEAIISLAPDLILASGYNRVGGEDPFQLIHDAGIAVCYIPTTASIDGIYQDIAFIAQVFGVPDRGAQIINRMKDDINTTIGKVKSLDAKRTVYFEISPAPDLITFGQDTFLNEMIEIIGARNIFGNERGWIAISAEKLFEYDPDVILTNVNYIDNPLEEIRSREGFETLTAVKNNRIYTIDADSSSRPSHHIILALEQMARAVYPEIFE